MFAGELTVNSYDEVRYRIPGTCVDACGATGLNKSWILTEGKIDETPNTQISSGFMSCPSDCALPGVGSSADRSIRGTIRQHA
jgi:hypothetical protein